MIQCYNHPPFLAAFTALTVCVILCENNVLQMDVIVVILCVCVCVRVGGNVGSRTQVCDAAQTK